MSGDVIPCSGRSGVYCRIFHFLSESVVVSLSSVPAGAGPSGASQGSVGTLNASDRHWQHGTANLNQTAGPDGTGSRATEPVQVSSRRWMTHLRGGSRRGARKRVGGYDGRGGGGPDWTAAICSCSQQGGDAASMAVVETRLKERLTGTTKGAAWEPESLGLAGRMPHNHDTTSRAGFIHHLVNRGDHQTSALQHHCQVFQLESPSTTLPGPPPGARALRGPPQLLQAGRLLSLSLSSSFQQTPRQLCISAAACSRGCLRWPLPRCCSRPTSLPLSTRGPRDRPWDRESAVCLAHAEAGGNLQYPSGCLSLDLISEAGAPAARRASGSRWADYNHHAGGGLGA